MQRDWLQQPASSDPEPKMTGNLERYDLVYLEGWQQAVSDIEDSELLEAALGGPDTGVRIRNMRRVGYTLTSVKQIVQPPGKNRSICGKTTTWFAEPGK